MSEPESDVEKQTISVHELLEESARAALDIQREDGSFPPGHNGPYQDNATPIRNTANWLKILAFVYNQTEIEKFKHASSAAIDYLKRDDHRPHGYTYKCRDTSTNEKDLCNGVVGQANVIEAMARAADYLDRPELYDYTAKIYHLHPFNENLGVWNRVEVDGTVLSIDRTFNHQLIFAAASALIADQSGREEIRLDISSFLDNLDRSMSWDSSGRIIHRLRPEFQITDIKSTILNRSPELLINHILHTKRLFLPDSEMEMKELGYHSVNLYWLACLKNRMPEHETWSRLPLQAFLGVTRRPDYRSLAEQSNEWFSSIPPGFQIAHAIHVFEQDPDIIEMKYWVKMVLNNHYNKETKLFNENCRDADTFMGLLYQAIDLPNLTVELLSSSNCV